MFRSGTSSSLLALVRDITERKRAEAAIQQTQEQLEARVAERTAELARANDVQVAALEALRRSELRIARMTANVPGMVYQLLLQEDGTASFPYVSEGCRELFGLEPAVMRPDACTLLDLIHPEDIGAFLTTLDASKLSGAAWAWEGRYVTGSAHETRWLQGTARPERQPDGSTLWDGLLLDITTRKRAEQGIEDRARQAAAVAALGQSALASSNHLSLSQAAADGVINTLGVEMCIVTELLPGGRELVARAGAGFDRNICDTTFPAGAESLAGYAILEGQPLIIDDLRVTKRCKISSLWLGNGAISSLSVVIQGRGQPLGALCIAARQARHFEPEDVNFLQSVANVLATHDGPRARRTGPAQERGAQRRHPANRARPHHHDRPRGAASWSSTRRRKKPSATVVPPRWADPSASWCLTCSASVRKTWANASNCPPATPPARVLTAELAVTRIPVEGPALFTAYLRDITQRKQAHEAALDRPRRKPNAPTAPRANSFRA